MEEQDNVVNNNADMASHAVTVQDGSPYVCKPNQSVAKKISVYAFPFLICIVYLAVVIFMIVMFYRLVRATEKIAAKLEGGITVRKENADNDV